MLFYSGCITRYKKQKSQRTSLMYLNIFSNCKWLLLHLISDPVYSMCDQWSNQLFYLCMTFAISNICVCVYVYESVCVCVPSSPSSDSVNRVPYLKWFWSVSLRRKYNLVAELQVHILKSLQGNVSFSEFLWACWS